MSTLLTLEEGADAGALKRRLQGLGLWVELLKGASGQSGALLVKAHSQAVRQSVLEDLPGVAMVLGSSSQHPKLDAAREGALRLERGEVRVEIGGGAAPVLAAGPCAVESEAQIHAAAAMVAKSGGRLLRGGAFKPRTSPYDFDGHGREALTWLREAADAHGLLVVSEILSERDVEVAAQWVDLVQIGSRNMSNFALLKAVGASGSPLLLKRGVAATLKEWRLAAEHALSAGAQGVIICERGIKGFDPETRNTLDLAGAALLTGEGHPVMVDPSHAVGRRDLVTPLSRAALALGCAGLLVEAHPDAQSALSDGPQALCAQELETLTQMIQLEGR